MLQGATRIDIVRDFQNAFAAAISEGKLLSQFRDDFDNIIARHGWSYNGSLSWRSRLIYITNVRSVYAARQWQQFQETKEALPYLRYLTAGDERVTHPYMPQLKL